MISQIKYSVSIAVDLLEKPYVFSKLENSVDLHNESTELCGFPGIVFYGVMRKIGVSLVQFDGARLWSG